MRRRLASALSLLAVTCALAAPGCGSARRSVYYGTMEQLGWEKRHLLADRVEEARDDQEAVREQFQSTLDAFKAVTGFEGGDLEDVYRRLQGEYEESEERAAEVRERIDSIEQVAGDLFAEWESEIGQISDATLRRRSEERLRATRARYQQFIAAMQRSSGAMDPALTAFRDRVLYLKHNLNARAIASLEGDVGEVEADVERLVRDVEEAIAEAESFLRTIDDGSGAGGL